MKIIIVIVLAFVSPCFAALKISTYNIKNFDSARIKTNKPLLKKIIQDLDTDLIAVQEIVNKKSFVKFIQQEFPDYGVFISPCGGAGRQKQGFVYRLRKLQMLFAYEDHRVAKVAASKPRESGCQSLRPALVGMFLEKKSQKEFHALSFHLKAGGGDKNYRKRAKQYKVLKTLVQEIKEKGNGEIILLGDFNTTGYLNRDSDYLNFMKSLDSLKMDDSGIHLECSSYWSGKNRKDEVEEPSLLDHIAHPSQFLGYTRQTVTLASHCKKTQCQIVRKQELGKSYKEVSDHCPVSVEFFE